MSPSAAKYEREDLPPREASGSRAECGDERAQHGQPAPLSNLDK